MVEHARGKHRNEERSWHSLRLFLLYRIGLSTLLLVMFFINQRSDLGSVDSRLFLNTGYALLGINLLLLAPTYLRWLQFRWLVFLMAGLDILALILMLHASGGISSGLAMLIIPSIAAVGLLLPGRLALFFAAIATLAVLAELVYGHWNDLYHNPDYTKAGIHGMIYFVIASLAAKLARRVKDSEATVSELDENLASVREMNEQIIDNMQSGVCVVGDDGRIRLVNQAAKKILSITSMAQAQKIADISDALYTSFSVWRKRRDDRSYEHNAVNKTGSDFSARFICAGEGKQAVTLIFIEDVTERNRQVQAMKLASLGRFTASIAHEIRNPLGAISHATQLLGESANLSTEDQRLVTITDTNCRRMNHIIEDILNLSRRNPPAPDNIMLSDWLNEISTEYRDLKLSPENSLKLITPVSEATATFDSNQLRQIIWNLLNNAQSHGDTEQSGVDIIVKSDLPESGDFAHIDVINNGKPISEEHEKQLFEPFFTTNHEGTGLGLYLSRELCENNGGNLDYIRMEDGQTCFRIKLQKTAA